MSKLDMFLARCYHLAARGGTSVSPNPQVGAVVVHENKIIGEGYHAVYGGPHAEVNALESVQNKALLAKATLYVSLEPCNHHGKTPPCTDRILEAGIKQVVIGMQDPNPLVSGKGIDKLSATGVSVDVRNDDKFLWQNRRFVVNQLHKRPYLVLKWAETADGYIGMREGNRLLISGPQALAYTHQLRAENSAILVGSGTAEADNPQLNVRYYPGVSPKRLILGSKQGLTPTLGDEDIEWLTLPLPQNGEKDRFAQLYADLYHQWQIGSILVEGGLKLLQTHIDMGLFDEIHILKSKLTYPNADVPSPILPLHLSQEMPQRLGEDSLIRIFATHLREALTAN